MSRCWCLPGCGLITQCERISVYLSRSRRVGFAGWAFNCELAAGALMGPIGTNRRVELLPIRPCGSQRCITQHELVQRHTALFAGSGDGGQGRLLARRCSRLSDGSALVPREGRVQDANLYWGKKTRSTNPVIQSRQRCSVGLLDIPAQAHQALGLIVLADDPTRRACCPG